MRTLVGAFSGAMPLLIGYVLGAGRLNKPACLPYGTLFLSQLPALHVHRVDVSRKLRPGGLMPGHSSRSILQRRLEKT